MARPAKFDRSEAMESAMEEIWRNGYEASSVKALSEKLGITRSSFYNAFGSRESLFREILDLYLSRTPDRPLVTATPAIPIKLLLTTTFRDVCKVRAGDPDGKGCLAVNGVAELCNTHDELGPVLDKAMLGSFRRIEQLLEWGVAQGEIDPDVDIHALALAVKTLLVGLNVMCKVVRDENELWKVAETTLRGLNLLADDTP